MEAEVTGIPHSAAKVPLNDAAHDWRLLLPLWAFLAVWFGQFFLALAPSWSDGTYYDYGFLTPPLVVMIFATRWSEATANIAPKALLESVGTTFRSRVVWVVGFLSILMAALLRLMETVDSGWRAPLYLHWVLVWGLTALVLGKSIGFRQTLPFIPIVILTFLSIPLPSSIEFSLIHGLTEQVMETSVSINQFMGYPLTMSGETIFANGIPLQVSEGCSGIRSFQSSIFASFVIGEFLRLKWPLRIVLIFASALAAFIGNSGRVIFLVRHAFEHGDENLQKLHDVSGYVSLAITMAAIFLIGLALDRIRIRTRKP